MNSRNVIIMLFTCMSLVVTAGCKSKKDEVKPADVNQAVSGSQNEAVQKDAEPNKKADDAANVVDEVVNKVDEAAKDAADSAKAVAENVVEATKEAKEEIVNAVDEAVKEVVDNKADDVAEQPSVNSETADVAQDTSDKTEQETDQVIVKEPQKEEVKEIPVEPSVEVKAEAKEIKEAETVQVVAPSKEPANVNVASTELHVADVLKGLKNTQNFAKHTADHIFNGTVNAKNQATGYHYDPIGDSDGKIVGAKGKPNKFGVYEASVSVKGIKKLRKSSFFPDNRTPQEIVDDINNAYQHRKPISNRDEAYYGYTKSGMCIQMFVDSRNNKITSAFPKFDNAKCSVY